MKKFLTAIILSIAMAIGFTIMAGAEELTLYIDQNTAVDASEQNGTPEAPYSRIETALGTVKDAEADTIVVFLMGDYAQPVGGNGIGLVNKTVKFTSESSDTQFKLPDGTLYPCTPTETGKGAVEFDNLTLVRGLTGSKNYDIDFRKFDFTLGENLKVSGNIYINQNWADETTVDNQVINIDSTQWANLYVNLGTTSNGIVKGTSTVSVNGLATFHTIGSGFTTKGASFLGTQNYIFNSGSTIRELFFGVGSAQKGKRYVQVNGNTGILDLYTTGDSGSLTSDSYSGVNIIEINSEATINRTGGEETTGGVNRTEPANYKKINVYPNSEAAWANVTRVVIFNNNVLTDVEVADKAAIVLRVAEGGTAQAVTTEPKEENDWDCELSGFEITLPEDKELVYIDGVLAEENEDGLYIIAEAGEHAVTFGNKYTVTIGEESAKYNPGEVIELPEAPAHDNAEHYTFKWSDGENTYDIGAEYTVNGDVTFTAVWTAKTYKVTFMNGDVPVFEADIAYGEVITAPEAPSKNGHSFDGWYNGDAMFTEGTTVSGNVTYTAKYTAEKYDITVNAVPTEGGTVSGAGNFEYGTEATLTAAPEFGYAFDGWYIGEEKVSDSVALVVEVKAAVTYTAKFVLADVEITGSLSIAREEGTPYNVGYEDGSVYNNAAKITIYNDEDLIFSGNESADGSTEFKFTAKLGTYRVVIEKNGYVRFDEKIEIKTGDELSNIKLIPGDIKESYENACGDGTIDIDDFIRVLRGFAASEEDKLFHAVDINEDRAVNVTDLGYIKTAMSK